MYTFDTLLMKYFISIINTAILGMFFFVALGCSSIQKRVSDDFQLKNAPVRVAVLPFDLSALNAEDQEIAALFRRIFYNRFSYLAYIDMDINEINEVLSENMMTDTEDIYLLSYDYLAEILDVDALIYCTVKKVSNLTTGIYAETSIEAELKMVDTRTGSIIWEAESKEVALSGILSPSSVVTLIQKQIDNSKKREALIKIADKFSKKIVKTIPNPSPFIVNNIQLPKIYTLKTNINNKTKDEGFILEVHLTGEKGMKATFDIGDWKTDLSMEEQYPGEYIGHYKVMIEDHLKSALIVGKLENSDGFVSKKNYEKGLVSFGPVY